MWKKTSPYAYPSRPHAYPLVRVALDKEGLIRGRLGARLVLAETSLGVSARTRQQRLPRGFLVFRVALPCLEARLLKRTPERERERPARTQSRQNTREVSHRGQ